ncbi:MAG: heat-inducible transcriptional repressor HrcA [Gammaproteobacteria bacterium]|nr:heat-inducible transcriptional repressor HrcA [Gammaproteobacteria bacterium]
MTQEISERALRLLKTLVESYVREGQPVGSRMLARDSGLDLSPATIRNIMTDLEDRGIVASPHTSAGRIPTTKGYRLFVDALLTMRQPDQAEVMRLKSQFSLGADVEHLLGSASSMLSGITRMAGVVMAPRRELTVLRQIEFLPLSGDNRVLVIVVTNQYQVQNRIINTPRRYSESELQQVANYLNAAFAGKDLHAIRSVLLSEMDAARTTMNDMMQTAVTMAEKVFAAPADEAGYVVAGQTNLMDFAELSSVEKLRQLFDAFSQKRDMLHLLDQCLRAETVQVFIGAESGYKAFDECSIVAAPYEIDSQAVGVLAVVGPTRMAYDRVIPLVDVTAKLLGAALNQRQ